jgi:ubiquinone/menaquinone biosynthesis C-methylase UbiE
MSDDIKSHPLDLSRLEKRKLEEIEHSRRRRTILQGFERHSDTHADERAGNIDRMIRDKEAFEKHFANVKYYSVTRASEDYLYAFLREHCHEGVRVLDFACGNGENGLFAAQQGADVTGIDISPEGVENANLNAKEAGVDSHCRFEVMDGENLTFKDDSFDVIVEYGALHHVELDRALSEMRRVLKPTGAMICVEALRHNPLIHGYRRLTPHLRTKWEVDHILGVDSLDTVREHFREVDVRFFHLAALAAVPFRKTRFFQPLRRALDAIDAKLLSSPSVGRFAWIMIFTARGPKG